MDNYQNIKEAVGLLIDQDSFGKYDESFARSLNTQPIWSYRQASAAYKMLQKYRESLSALELEIEKPEENVNIETYKIANFKNNKIIVRFKCKDEQEFKNILSTVKELPGREYDADSKTWNLPFTIYTYEKLKDLKFDISSALKSKYDTEKNKNIPQIKINSKYVLRPFQIEGVQKLEQLNGRVLLADEMGLGKSCQSLIYLHNHPELRPAMIVCPASLKINWGREIEKWIPEEKYSIVSGKSGMGGKEENIVVINYDIIDRYIETILESLKPKILLLDESHYIRNVKTKRCKAVKYIGKRIDHIIAISGTPIVNRPSEFFTTLNLLMPDVFNSFYRFQQEFCEATYNGFGWSYKGARNSDRLHDILVSTCMIRRLKKDVLSELPEKQYQILPFPLTNEKEYRYAEAELIEYIRETEGEEKARKASYAEHIIRFEKLKQLAVAGKMESAKEWISNFIESEKLVIFCMHHSAIDKLMEMFGDVAVKLDGRDSLKERQKSIDSFQNDPNIRLFVGNILAAGVGINLTASSNVAFLEFAWTPGQMIQAEDRCHRLGTVADSVNIYYLVGLDTIEEEIAGIIDAKKIVLGEILDGELPSEKSLITELISRYKEKNHASNL